MLQHSGASVYVYTHYIFLNFLPKNPLEQFYLTTCVYTFIPVWHCWFGWDYSKTWMKFFFPFVSMKPRAWAGTLWQVLLIDMSLKKPTYFQNVMSKNLCFILFQKNAFWTGFICIISTTNLFQTLLIPQSNFTIFSDMILPVPATYSK